MIRMRRKASLIRCPHCHERLGKWCPECFEWKPHAEFAWKGRAPYCKPCMNRYIKRVRRGAS